MAIIALKAWYLQDYEPIRELEKRPHDLRLSKNSLLKSALRADFLEDSEEVKQSAWFQRYLEGETVEFYIEGSGGYAISNIDLISHEIYFTKQDVMAHLEPIIFLCYQTEYAQSSDLLREAIQTFLDKLNKRSRLPLTLEESNRLTEGPIRLNSSLMRKIRKCLLFVADGTPILHIDNNPPQLIPSPNVCVEVGYALEAKRSEQILLAHMERSDVAGQFPFDLPSHSRLVFRNKTDLQKTLPTVMEAQLQRFNLF
ncbi:hypothetical protein [Thermocoleostomius sinensis]|uniref:Uncharacterized protein n=1 Tax=Thermocoleostomius sinensis A174 TaxID=2016057 RepID=A0A9E9C6G0_9CYAN|nr:hypothetical protein [Thermocoleostomius sinensis]WAL58143.1 hypothetical protein OXH18_13155 [Thermocoleostomius sinensis A174]